MQEKEQCTWKWNKIDSEWCVCVSVCPHIYFCAMFSVSFGLVHFVCLYVHIFIFVPCFQCHLAWCILCVCMSTYLFLCHVFSVIWPGAFCVSVCPHIYFCAMFSVSFGLVHFVCLYVHIFIFVPCFQCHLAWCILWQDLRCNWTQSGAMIHWLLTRLSIIIS